MFEKETEEHAKKILKALHVMNGREWAIHDVTFKDGAEFGYNKANEWNIETPSSVVSNKDLLLQVEKDDFVVGYYHFEKKRFYTNDGQEVIPLAWKEIHYPQESEK